MFEFAISAGEGTLLNYGVAHSTALNALLPIMGGLYLSENGDFHLQGVNNNRYTDYVYSFTRASPDCTTGP